MGRVALIALCVCGCSFDPAGVGAGGAIDARAQFDATRGADAPLGTPDGSRAAPCPDDADLVACYRFETGDAKNEPKDESQGGNNGTSTNVTFIAGPPGHGQAISFSPTATSLVPDSATLDVTAITIEMWVYVRSLPLQNARAGFLDDNNQYGLFLAPDGGVRCAIGSSTDITLTIATGAWTHVACTYDGFTIQLYQDGRPGVPADDLNGIPTASTDGLGLGQNVPSGDHLDGAEDDVRIWRVARSASQICGDAAPNC